MDTFCSREFGVEGGNEAVIKNALARSVEPGLTPDLASGLKLKLTTCEQQNLLQLELGRIQIQLLGDLAGHPLLMRIEIAIRRSDRNNHAHQQARHFHISTHLAQRLASLGLANILVELQPPTSLPGPLNTVADVA